MSLINRGKIPKNYDMNTAFFNEQNPLMINKPMK
jgi:hypothetical protein